MFVDENGGGRGYAPIIVRRAEFLGPVRSNASTRNAALRVSIPGEPSVSIWRFGPTALIESKKLANLSLFAFVS
jgi:hypothetical protein